jgi:hypothetical protein
VSRNGVILSQAYGGGGGNRGYAIGETAKGVNGATGSAGGGSDGVVTAGGGMAGGAGGSATSTNVTQPADGVVGSVLIEY